VPDNVAWAVSRIRTLAVVTPELCTLSTCLSGATATVSGWQRSLSLQSNSGHLAQEA